MNTQNKKPSNLFLRLVAVSVLLLSGNYAFADDINPLLYQGDPPSVHEYCQLDSRITNLDLIHWSSVDDSNPSTYQYPNSTPSISVQSNCNTYQLQLPNFVDEQPVKYMRIQLVHLNTPQPMINLLSEGIDGANPITGTITAASPLIITPTGYYQYFDFELKQNPDSERVHVEVPPNGLLSNIIIYTVSTIPKPTAITLIGFSCLVLLRKRRK